jgi:predicted  nucleic acid-binding Zn-ribbon protein
MKASVEQQIKLVELAGFDQAFDQYSSQAKNHPDREIVKSLKDNAEQIDFEIIEYTARTGDLKKEITKVEIEIEQVRSRVDKDQIRVDTGSNAKEVAAMEHEITSLKARQNEIENQELVLLEQMEEIETQLKSLSSQKSEIEDKAKQASEKLTTELLALKVAADEVNQKRKELVSQIDSELVEKYQKIKSEHQGIAAARLIEGACSGCNISYSPIELQEIRASDPQLIMQCENCNCILVRS